MKKTVQAQPRASHQHSCHQTCLKVQAALKIGVPEASICEVEAKDKVFSTKPTYDENSRPPDRYHVTPSSLNDDIRKHNAPAPLAHEPLDQNSATKSEKPLFAKYSKNITADANFPANKRARAESLSNDDEFTFESSQLDLFCSPVNRATTKIRPETPHPGMRDTSHDSSIEFLDDEQHLNQDSVKNSDIPRVVARPKATQPQNDPGTTPPRSRYLPKLQYKDLLPKNATFKIVEHSTWPPSMLART